MGVAIYLNLEILSCMQLFNIANAQKCHGIHYQKIVNGPVNVGDLME